MIIRQALRLQGRRFALPAVPRPIRRRYATASVDMIEQSLENSLKETHHIENELQETTIDLVPRIDDETHETQNPLADKPSRNPQDRKFLAIGSRVSPGYVPFEKIASPSAPSEVTLAQLMAAQAHMGHATALWNPMNSRWIFGVRAGIHIISLEQTAAHLRRACRVVEGVAERGGLILFAGTRRGQARAVVAAARRAGGYHLFDRWRPGVITNRMVMLNEIGLKAVDPLDRPLEGFTEELHEMPPVIPDLIVCFNPLENYVMLHECALASIPTIGVIDTDANPTWVTYPIPANDDSPRCIQLIAGALGVAGETGNKRRLERARRGEVQHTTRNMEHVRIRDS